MIMYASEINIRGHLAVGECFVEMLRAGFRHTEVTDAVEIPIFDGHFPTPPGFIRFLGNNVFHDFLPRAGD